MTPFIRSDRGPLITTDTHPSLGGNVNGPTLLRVPDWLPNPLGRYYLYFAHHQGAFIRLAYADDVEGPYTLHEPGVLHIDDCPFRGHIASPDVHFDEARGRVWMHYHGCGYSGSGDNPYGQATCYAESADGLNFSSDDLCVGPSYLRTFRRAGWHYGFAGGPGRRWYRARSPRDPFEEGVPLEIPGEPFSSQEEILRLGIDSVYRIRHVALHLQGDRLAIYYSNVGDAPERIKRTVVRLDRPWREWSGEAFEEILRSETSREGVDEPVERSRGGSSRTPVHQLRDPFLFVEDTRTFLLYTIAGEFGIGLTELPGTA